MKAPEFLKWSQGRGLVLFETCANKIKIVGPTPAIEEMKKIGPPKEEELRPLVSDQTYRRWLTVDRMKPTAPGWSVMRSIKLSEPIVIVRDDDVRIPAEVAQYAVYALSELEMMRTASDGAVKDIHRLKKAMPTKLVTFDGMVH